MTRPLAFLLTLSAVVCAAATAEAVTLDPFTPAAGPRAGHLDPFRKVADNAPAPTATATPTPASPAPRTCQRDEDCLGENICQANVCQPIQLRTNIAYLYYREGAFTEALGLYWSRKGTPGYTVLAPLYWHFWGPASSTLVLAPFYWRFEDRARRSLVTWYGPVVAGHQGASSLFGVIPLFYASGTGSWAAWFLGTGRFKDPETHATAGAVAYLYWWTRSPTRSRDMLFPIFFSTRTAARTFTFALPLNFYWRHEDDSNLLALPLFFHSSHQTGGWFLTWLGYAHREGTEYGRSLAWLYWWGGDDKAQSRYHVFFPLLWDFEGKNDGTTVLFPLVWSFRGPTSNTTVAANFVHVRDGSWTFNTFFPLYWSSRDDKTGRAHKLLLPFFYWDRADHDRASTLVTLLGGYRRDDVEGTRTWAILPLLSYAHHDRGGAQKMLTPLYLEHDDRDADSVARLIALLFYRRSDPEGSTTTLFPLFWHFWDAETGATATAFLPLFGHRSGPRDTSTFVGPVYWRSFKNGGWSAGLFPIAYFGSNAGRGHGVLFPLFWHFSSEQSSTTVLFPLFYHHRDAGGSDTAVTPLFYAGDHRGERYAVLFPLLFYNASARERSSAAFTPVGFYQSDPDGTSVALGPIIPLLYWRIGHDRSHFALVPLFWHFQDHQKDTSTTVIGPYWHHRWGGETTDGLFPLFAYRRGAHPGGSDGTGLTVFPLFHYRRDGDTRLFVTLLGASVHTANGEGGFVGPFIWFKNRAFDAKLVPLLYTDVLRRADGQHLVQWGPWFKVEGPGYEAHGLLPLFGHYADAKESDTWVIPSYFRLRRANGDGVDTLPPLFWHSSFGGRSTTVVGLYFARTTPTATTYGLVPLFIHARNTERSLTAVPPLLLYQRRAADGTSDWFSCLLFVHDRDPEGTLNTLFPIFYSNSKKDHRTDILFPVFWHFHDKANDSEHTLAGPFYWSHTKGERTRGLLPVAWYTRNDDNGDASQALLPLFYEGHGRDQFSFYTLLGGYHRRAASHFWYAGPVLHTDNVQTSFSMVAPLWFSHTKKATDTTTTVIPPLLHVSRSNPETAFSSTLLLFWHYRDIASSTYVGLPLYYDVQQYHLSRTTLFVPFFGRYENEATHEATTIIPPLLFYRHSTPTDLTMVAFPLLWDFKHGNDRTTVMFPFFVRRQSDGHEGTWVFPNYYRSQGLRADGSPDGTYRLYVFPFFDSGVKRPGDFMWEVLGGLFGHERIGRHNYLRLFYFTIETSPTMVDKAAWYGQPVAPRRKAVPRGLHVAGW
ncbi:MAG TPA: hypothetical protein VN853_16300 [Polyangia bacterium]|nr:hypothetical protein [Polyangia bacterium]